MFDSKEIAKQALLRAEEIKEENNIKGKRWKIASALTACAVCVVMVVIFSPLGMKPDGYMMADTDPMPLAALMLPDDNAVPFVTGEGDEQAADVSGFIIPGYDFIRIPAETTYVNMLLINPVGNPGDFTFEIMLKKSGETLYKSGLVAPSMCLENVTISRPLLKGAYEAYLKINIYEPHSQSAIGDAGVDFVLIVE